MTLDIRWRLGRLRATARGALRHLHREGPLKTLTRAARQLRESVAGSMPAPGMTDTDNHDDGKPRILIVDALMPDPSRDSGSLRLCHLMRILQDMGWNIDFMPDSLHANDTEKAALADNGIHTLCRPRTRSLPAWLKREGPSLDAVMLCRHYVANTHLSLVRKYAPSARVLFDTVDLHHIREMRAARHADDPERERRARRTRHQELDLIRQADTTFVVSSMEKQWLEEDLPDADIRLLSNIHHTHPCGPDFDDRQDLMFVGGWGHPPNRDAIHWLVEEIMPLIRQQLPEMVLHLIGDLPEQARAPLQQPGIHIHGRVPNLEPLLQQCRLSLAPLRYGAGVKGKINQAMGYGVPVVATSMAVEGMYLTDGQDVLVADTAETFAAAVARVYQDPVLWRTLASDGMDNVRQHFSFEAARQCLESVLTATPP